MKEKTTALPVLTALKAISNGGLQGETLPSKIKLLNWGENKSTVGPIFFDEVSVKAMAVNQALHGFDRVAIDFQHNTVKGTVEYERTKEPRDVGGYGVPVCVPNDGLYLDQIQWTPCGEKSARNFADLSPTPALDENRRVTFLHSVGLVRNGAVDGLSFFSAEDPIQTMTDITLADLAQAMGLPATATKPDVLGKLTAFFAQERGEEAHTFTAKANVAGKIVTLSADDLAGRVVALEGQLAATTTAATESAKATVLVAFSAEGKAPVNPATRKAYSAEELKALDLATLQILHANTPVTVPLSARSAGAAETVKVDPNLKGRARTEAAFEALNRK